MGGLGGGSDQNPIMLKIRGCIHKPPSPFKFNATWILDPEFIELLKENWMHLNNQEGFKVGYMFMENLKRLKKVTL